VALILKNEGVYGYSFGYVCLYGRFISADVMRDRSLIGLCPILMYDLYEFNTKLDLVWCLSVSVMKIWILNMF